MFLGRALELAAIGGVAVLAGASVCPRGLIDDRIERVVITAVLGLAVIAQALHMLGLFGMLTRGAVIGTIAGLVAIGGLRWVRDPARAARLIAGFRSRLLAAVLLATAPLLVLALYPPIAFDETLYHLPFARAFVRTAALPFLPELRVPVFPPLAELLFSGMLLLHDDVSTHLVSVLAVLLTTALLAAWGRSVSTGTGGLAAALFLGGPIVFQLGATGYVEPLLALFVTAALFACERWRLTRRAGWLVLSATFAASAGGVKYFGLFFVPAIAALILTAGRDMRRVRSAALFLAVAFGLLAPVYGRILALTGSPLFPFLPGVFGHTPWDPVTMPTAAWAARAAFPWRAVFARQLVGQQAPYSPFVLLGAPFLYLCVMRQAWSRRYLLIAVLYACAVPVDARYLLPVLPVWCLGIAAGLPDRWAMKSTAVVRARVMAGALALVLLPGWTYAGWRIALLGPPPLTLADRERFLTRRLPAYGAVAWLNDHGGDGYTVYAVHAENMVYLARGTLLGDWTGPASFQRVLPLAADPRALHRTLRDLGVDFLLVAKNTGEFRLPRSEAEFPRLFQKVYEDSATELYRLTA
jgi:hypothetical protein